MGRIRVPAVLAPRRQDLASILAGKSVPTKKFMWRPLRSELPLPEFLEDLIRLSRSICIDCRSVDATGVNTGLPGAMTWVQILTWQSTHSAQVCLDCNPYHFGGYSATQDSNGDRMPTDTTNDAAHLTLIQSYITIIKAAGVTVRNVFLDSEYFPWATPNNTSTQSGHTVANNTWNTAHNLKYSQVYDLFKNAVTGFGAGPHGQSGTGDVNVSFYGKGSIRPHSGAEVAMTVPNSWTDPSDSPYPYSAMFGPEAWSGERYDKTDVTPAYTLGTVAPFMGDAICPALYYPHEFITTCLTQQFSHNDQPASPIIPYLGMGWGRNRSFSSYTGVAGALSYSTEISKLYGAMFDNAPYWNTVARRQRWWYENLEIILYPAPNDTVQALNIIDHIAAFVDGCNS